MIIPYSGGVGIGVGNRTRLIMTRLMVLMMMVMVRHLVALQRVLESKTQASVIDSYLAIVCGYCTSFMTMIVFVVVIKVMMIIRLLVALQRY